VYCYLQVSKTLKAMQAVEAQLEELDTLSDGYERALMHKMVDAVRVHTKCSCFAGVQKS